jgi:hypothetical protein
LVAGHVPTNRPPFFRCFYGSPLEPLAKVTRAPDLALVALRLADRGDLANEIVARKIIALAKAGERDPERLCEGVLQEFRGPPPRI